ncbi:sensor histidine kinase [Thauera sp. Sel9]|uniref:sensor histidine kinase n=1 Tax=Thauera sp. Sel9 TaxID=2974299 RepID=UPI0021E1450F|nr:ATP-binding protein [Thauera sp. Sel9]MCV2217273.1 ATP-binding protein [Thauera sp. Sel9]
MKQLHRQPDTPLPAATEPQPAGAAAAEPEIAALRTGGSRLLHLRWLSVAAMVAMAALVFPLLAPDHSVQPLLGVALILAVANLLLLAGPARWLDGRRGAFAQLLFDLLGWGAFLYFGGGVTNPAAALLLPVVAVGASILPARQAWALAAVAVGIYAALWEFHHPVQLADAATAMQWHLAGMWLSFSLAAAIVVWFIVRLNAELTKGEAALAEARAARARDAYVVGLGNLAAGAAHRLGTPLGTLRILTGELLRRKELDAEVREDLGVMREQLEHCREILNSLTREAGRQRAEGGGAECAGSWLHETAVRWQRLRPEAGLRLDIAPELSALSLVADASLVEALQNLIDNAANANAAAGRAGAAVEVRAVPDGGMLRIEVLDRGPGIDDARLEAARHAPLGSHAEGMGVGLMLAHAAVEHHGGRLAFLARPGGGTIARVAVPLRPS